MDKKTFFGILSWELVVQSIILILFNLASSGWLWFFANDLFPEKTAVFWVSFLSSVFLIIVVTVFLFYKIVRKNHSSDFEILEEEITHKVDSKIKTTHTRKYKLRVLKNGVRWYNDKFKWTGDEEKTTIKSGNQHSVTQTKDIGIYDTYEVRFDRQYNKGEFVEVEVIFELFGEGDPFIAKQVEDPIGKLILNVEFDKGISINNLCLSEFNFTSGKYLINHTELNLKNHAISQTIYNPKFHNYEIRWQW